MAVLALITGVLAGPALGITFATGGGAAGALLGARLLSGAARNDARARAPRTDRLMLAPIGVLVGMLLLPRLFDVIGYPLGWGLVTGASAFIAAATFATSRSAEIFGPSG